MVEKYLLRKRPRDFLKGVKKQLPKVLENSNRILIIHGHDELSKEQLARMLADMGHKPVILLEQPDRGRTIIEKIEEEIESTDFVFAILTPDDVGIDRELYERGGKTRFNYRARQNVIFELGYTYAKKQRKNVCCLCKGNVEIPSDILGILYIKFKENIKEAYQDIVKELKEANLL